MSGDFLFYNEILFLNNNFGNQKNNVPPRTKVLGLISTCFLNAQSVLHSKECDFQTL